MATPRPPRAALVWSPGYRIGFFGIERLHPFDIGKYDRIAAELTRLGVVDGLITPEPPEPAHLAEVHAPAYLEDLRRTRTIAQALEVPVPAFVPGWLVDRRVLGPMRLACGGTVAAARAALTHGLGVNLGGGYHHAHPAMGHGFCVYNDVAIAIAALRRDGFGGRVLILDTDAHQGDGNHAFFHRDDTVTTASMHQAHIFPPRVPGDLDVELPAAADDAHCLTALERLLQLVDDIDPDLIFHVAGADVLHDDPLTGLAMTVDGLVERDRRVVERAAGRPVVHLLAGGYGPSAAAAQARSVAGLLA